MQITSIHLCRYDPEDIRALIAKDLAEQGLKLSEKKPSSTIEEGREILVFEATSIIVGQVVKPVKPKGAGVGRGKGGGRPKKVVQEAREVLAGSDRPLVSNGHLSQS